MDSINRAGSDYTRTMGGNLDCHEDKMDRNGKHCIAKGATTTNCGSYRAAAWNLAFSIQKVHI
jgi:hypothetical protein